MPAHIERAPERVPIVRVDNAVIFPHSSPRTIYGIGPPPLVAAIKRARFCIVAYAPREIGQFSKINTLVYVKKIGYKGDQCFIVVFPVERVLMQSIRLEKIHKEPFYASAYEKVEQTRIADAVWHSEEIYQKRLWVRDLFGEFLRNIERKIEKYIAENGESPETARAVERVREGDDLMPLLAQATPATFGAVMDKIGNAIGKIYCSVVHKPKLEVMYNVLYLLTQLDHALRLDHTIELLTWFHADLDNILTQEITMAEHLEEQISALTARVVEKFRFPIAELMDPN